MALTFLMGALMFHLDPFLIAINLILQIGADK